MDIGSAETGVQPMEEVLQASEALAEHVAFAAAAALPQVNADHQPLAQPQSESRQSQGEAPTAAGVQDQPAAALAGQPFTFAAQPAASIFTTRLPAASSSAPSEPPANGTHEDTQAQAQAETQAQAQAEGEAARKSSVSKQPKPRDSHLPLISDTPTLPVREKGPGGRERRRGEDRGRKRVIPS